MSSAMKPLPALAPGQVAHYRHGDHLFVLTGTVYCGIHTGRPRLGLSCMTCRLFIHEATTGAEPLMASHVRAMDNLNTADVKGDGHGIQ